jgi:hypothetical protein
MMVSVTSLVSVVVEGKKERKEKIGRGTKF